MAWITTRRYKLPTKTEEMANLTEYNCWKIRLPPFSGLMVGDLLYWYETPSQSLVWRTEVTSVDSFQYDTKQELRNKLIQFFGYLDESESYYLNSSTSGYCLAYKSRPLQKLNLPKPDRLQVNLRPGWLPVTREIASMWLAKEDLTPDEAHTDLPLLELLRQLNEHMAGVSPKRRKALMELMIRRDSRLIRVLKQTAEFRCQFPGCGVRIRKKDGGHYTEVAHIEPVSRGGKSVLGNLVVLCPNHHKEFDYGHREIAEQDEGYLRGKLNDIEFEIRLPLRARTPS